VSGIFDLLIVGGGINGVGIARDAAGRGLKVLLCEQGDLAGATSSASSKMIHGGLRYLEHYEFRLVRESLAEREILLRIAPHLVRPTEFVLPHGAGSRPRCMVRAGLFLYDRLGGARALPAAHALDLQSDPRGVPLKEAVRHAFVYSDCRVDDARLVVANARDAAVRGAEIMTRTALVQARREGGEWRVILQEQDGIRHEVAARLLVNAAGPWVGEVARRAGLRTRAALRLVKGSHIVVRRLHAGEHAYLLQNKDGRVVFVIPFERDVTLIGTTELPFGGDPGEVGATPEEIEYLCRAVAHWFRKAPQPDEVVWAFAGVRPLYDDGSGRMTAVSRDYVFELDEAGAPALSVFGGKLTTFRRLAEQALKRLSAHLPGAGPAWTADAVLPGGTGLAGGPAELAEQLRRGFPFLDGPTAERLTGSYGNEADKIFAGREPGCDVGHGLYEAEVDWLVAKEWARTAEDILWRRSKLGLRFSAEAAQALRNYLARPARHPAAAAAAAAPQRPDR
jgi:glycerol-3-phosphate dehydrogenase